MNPIIEEIKEKYSEWLEMAGDDSPALLTDILANLLAKEKSLNEYYKKRLNCREKNNVCSCSTN